MPIIFVIFGFLLVISGVRGKKIELNKVVNKNIKHESGFHEVTEAAGAYGELILLEEIFGNL